MDASTAQAIFAITLVIGGVVVYWRKGGNQATADANAALLQVTQANKMQIEQAQRDIAGLQERERANVQEIGRLNGVISEKDKQISILQSVDISKNPAFLKFMTYTMQVAERSEEFMNKSSQREDKMLAAITSVGDFMQKINAHFEKHSPQAVASTA